VNDDDLMKALREAARADQRAHPLPDSPASPGQDQRLLERLTAQAIAELRPAAPVLPLRRRGWIAGTAAISLAAAAAFLLMRQPEATALPPYRAEVMQGAELTMRGAQAADALVFRPGAPFELTLRPATTVQEPLRARAFLVQGEHREELAITQELRAHGTLAVRGTLPRALATPDDPAALSIIVARPEALADAESLRTDDPRFSQVRVEIRQPAP
jgi:hypothetical protein